MGNLYQRYSYTDGIWRGPIDNITSSEVVISPVEAFGNTTSYRGVYRGEFEADSYGNISGTIDSYFIYFKGRDIGFSFTDVNLDASQFFGLMRSGDPNFLDYVFSGDDFFSHTDSWYQSNGYGGNDTIIGGAYSDTITGGSGDDVISGEGGDDQLYGGSGKDFLDGGVGHDTIDGGAGNDTLTGGFGNDSLFGGQGVDVIFYGADLQSFSLLSEDGEVQIADRRGGGFGSDVATAIEQVFFDNPEAPFVVDIADFSNLSSSDFESFIELYIAYFNRSPDAIGLNFWGTAFANGTTLEQMATLFIDQDETRATYPEGTSNTDFVTAVYDNVLGRIPDQAGFNFWIDMLNRSEETGVTRDQFILEVLRGVQDGSPDRAYLDSKVDIGAYYAVHRGMSDPDNAAAAMALFDGTQASIDDAVAAIDGFYQDALDPINGEFLMQVVGVLDNPFAV